MKDFLKDFISMFVFTNAIILSVIALMLLIAKLFNRLKRRMKVDKKEKFINDLTIKTEQDGNDGKLNHLSPEDLFKSVLSQSYDQGYSDAKEEMENKVKPKEEMFKNGGFSNE